MRDVITVNVFGAEAEIISIYGSPDMVSSGGRKFATLRDANESLDTWVSPMRHVLFSIQKVDQENLGELTDG